MSVKAWVYTQVFSRADSKAWLKSMLLSALGNYYIKFRGIPSGGKSIKMLSRQWYHFYLHVWYIFFDQSSHSIFVRCQALVAFSLRSIVKYFFQHEKRNLSARSCNILYISPHRRHPRIFPSWRGWACVFSVAPLLQAFSASDNHSQASA